MLSFITFGLINLAAFIVALIFLTATMAASRHEFYKYPMNALHQVTVRPRQAQPACALSLVEPHLKGSVTLLIS